MGSIDVGTLWTNNGSCAYTCKITYDTPTRSGDKVKIKNVKATITWDNAHTAYQTRYRIAVTASVNGVNKASNKEIKRMNPDEWDDYWPTSCEATIIDNNGYEFDCLNTSFPISVTFRATGFSSNWNSDYGSASKDGNASCPARTYAVTYDADGGTWTYGNQTKTYGVDLNLIAHEPTKSSYTFKGWSGSNGITYQPGNTYKGNAALTLTAIWQAVATDFDDVETTEIGDYPVVKWTPPSADLTYKIKFTLGSWTDTTGTITPNTDTEFTYDQYQIPMDVCYQLPDDTEGLMQIDLETYSGETKTGTKTKYFTVTVPDSVVPEFDSVTIQKVSDNGLHLYLQNWTSVEATLYIDKAYYSEIAEVTMTIGDETMTVVPAPSLSPLYNTVTLTSDVLTKTGEKTVTITAKDTRGRTATTSDTITVYEYSAPSAEISVIQNGSTVTDRIWPHFSSVSGLNSATISINGGTAQSFTDGELIRETSQSDLNRSRNHTCTVVITDLVTSVTLTKKSHPGRDDRFKTLYDSKYYLGMDEQGWKATDSTFDGGITEAGVIWFDRTGGEGPTGIGLPMELEPDKDYELIYSANGMEEPAVLMSFYKMTSNSETGITYLGTTYNNSYLKSGDIFHTPQITGTATLVGILLLGSVASENTVRNEYYDIVIRKITQSTESLAWDVETGNLGLDTPNQKYISRIQQRVDYSGSLKIELAYDNDSSYATVHESTSDHMRSITVPIKVKRSDHFRIRLSGTGEVRLYSFGFQTDEGSERCLI